MEKTLLEKFNENPNMLNETFEIKRLNRKEDNSFEVTNELLDELDIPKENQNTIKFILYELTGNVYDHSRFSKACISGRFSDGKFDFIVKDDGISIIDSFRNANYHFDDECEALIKAVNGLSTKNDLGYIERGTGLNNTSNIVANGFKGEILIISSHATLYINNDKIITQKIPKDYKNGTIIHIRVDLSSSINMYNYLNHIEYKL